MENLNIKVADKLILVFYIGIERFMNNQPRAMEYMVNVKNAFEHLKDESTELIFIEQFETNESRVEAINPKLINEKDYEEVKKLVNEYKEKMKEFISR